jgi:ribosomal protein L34E
MAHFDVQKIESLFLCTCTDTLIEQAMKSRQVRLTRVPKTFAYQKSPCFQNVTRPSDTIVTCTAGGLKLMSFNKLRQVSAVQQTKHRKRQAQAIFKLRSDSYAWGETELSPVELAKTEG